MYITREADAIWISSSVLLIAFSENNSKQPHQLESSRRLKGKMKKEDEPGRIATNALKNVPYVFLSSHKHCF